jgi:hypothetical protein
MSTLAFGMRSTENDRLSIPENDRLSIPESDHTIQIIFAGFSPRTPGGLRKRNEHSAIYENDWFSFFAHRFNLLKPCAPYHCLAKLLFFVNGMQRTHIFLCMLLLLLIFLKKERKVFRFVSWFFVRSL